MSRWTISEVARRVALRPSTIRYYERIGVLPPAARTSGQRRYDEAVLYRLAVVQRARATGFTLTEIRQLFSGFPEATPISQRWRTLASKKLAELAAMAERLRAMQALLRRLERRCHCRAVEECGKAMYTAGCGGSTPRAKKRIETGGLSG
jgi:DNA-binding transcriptional MerR regulator